MEERLQKFLASSGVASRRKAEELILQGRVKVNEAQVTKLGTKVDPARDLVTVDGRLVSAPESRAYYVLYKPSGCVTTATTSTFGSASIGCGFPVPLKLPTFIQMASPYTPSVLNTSVFSIAV